MLGPWSLLGEAGKDPAEAVGRTAGPALKSSTGDEARRFSWACERGRVGPPGPVLAGASPGQPGFHVILTLDTQIPSRKGSLRKDLIKVTKGFIYLF